MQILSISLDKKILDKNSKTFKRQKEYVGLVDEYHIVVFGPKKEIKDENLFVYGSGGNNKISQFFKAHKIAKQILEDKDLRNWLITTQDPFFTGLLGYLLRSKFYIKLHIQVHGFERFFGLRKLIAKFIIPRADGLRVVSKRLKKRLIDEFGIKENIITVVYIFTPTNINLNIKQTEKLQKIISNHSAKQAEKLIFLTVGRLVPIKNIQLQVMAFIEVNKKYPSIELWIVGNGPGKKRIQDARNKIQAPYGVKLLGWQDNLDKFYSQADIFLLTSNYEGWPGVIIEAANYGLPIIMTDVGNAGEIIKDPSTSSGQASGIVIPINNQQALEQAMIKLIENKELRKKLGQGAKKALSKLPSKEETLELYKKSWQKTLKN